MRKLLPYICFVILFSSLTSVQAQQGEPQEKVMVEEIKMSLSALAIGGHFVSDLKPEDLVIIENGRLHQANTLRRVPANVLILLDTGGTMRGNLGATVSAAKSLIGSLSEEDSVAVFQVGDKPQMIADWTTDRSLAAASVQKKLAFGRRTALHRALREARGIFPDQKNENRHVVLITAGLDSFNDEKAKNDAVSDLLSTDINVHIISYTRLEKETASQQKEIFKQGEWKPKRLPEEIVQNLPDPKHPGRPEKDREVTSREIAKMPRLGGLSLDLERLLISRKRTQELNSAESFLDELAVNTNGVFLLPETLDEMNEKAAALAAIIDSQWVLAYTPKNPLSEAPPGDVRNIEITSKRTGVHIQARRKLILKSGNVGN